MTHDARNYVVDVGNVQLLQRLHLAVPDRRDRQLAPVDKAKPYTLAEQLALGRLPAQAALDDRRGAMRLPADVARITAVATAGQGGAVPPPWSAAHPYVNVYTLAEARRSRPSPATSA